MHETIMHARKKDVRALLYILFDSMALIASDRLETSGDRLF